MYDPNHRQLQITNKYICDALKRYVEHLRKVAKTTPAFARHSETRYDGAIDLLKFMGLKVVCENGEIVRVHKFTNDDMPITE